jgi:hypothetical protein
MKKVILLIAVLPLIFAGVCQAWQQRVAYNIEARLDTLEHKIYATQHLRYFNNSPDTLSSVWFHLYPNAYRDNSSFFAREAEQQQDYRFRHSGPEDKGWIEINSLLVSGNPAELKYGTEYDPPRLPRFGRFSEMTIFGGPNPDDIDIAKRDSFMVYRKSKQPKHVLDSTSASLDLPILVAPGDSIDFYFDFTVKVPKFFSRMGHNGNHYEISQWYPKIAVYDAKGWHADGYHYIGEFYGDYGSFQVGLTVPKDFKIGSTGEEIIDLGDTVSQGNDPTWYYLFAADNVHDFAWCANPEYSEISELHGDIAIKILYRPGQKERWKNVMQYAKDALDYYGKWYGQYPYSTLTVCDGDMAAGGGMEYPNMVIVSTGEDKYTRTLEMVVMHEIGHQWFYGILGNNEMDEAWLDEGINSFSEQRYFEEKYGPDGNYLAKESLRKLLPEASNRNVGRYINYLYAANRMEKHVLTRACAYDETGQYAASVYMKPAARMWWLKDYLGDSDFDRVMQGYCRDNRFKHVTTATFLDAVNNYADKNITRLKFLNGAAGGGYEVASVQNWKGNKDEYSIKLARSGYRYADSGIEVAPVLFEAKDSSGKEYKIFWSGAAKDTTIVLQTQGKLVSANIDPDNNLLETNRWNNCWPRRYRVTLGPRLPSFESYNMFWLPVPWYDNVNGFRLGAMLHGAYLADGDPMVGRHQWTFSPFYGFRSRELSFSFDYQTPVDLRSGASWVERYMFRRLPRAYLTAGSAFGINYAGVGLKRTWGPRLMLDPTESFDLKLDYTRYKDYRFWDPRDVDTAAVVSLIAQRGYGLTRHWGRSSFLSRITVGYIQRPESDINNYLKFELEEKLNVRINKHINPRFRLAAGYIQGPAPAQEQFFLAGSFKTTGLDNMLASGKDWFSTQEHYHVDGGANLPGYYGTHIRGKNLWAVNMTLPIMKSPASFFAGAGQIANDWLEFTAGSIRADAGLSLALGPIRLMFPLWINQPEPGKKQFDWRWTIGFGGSGMSIKF